MKLPSFAVLIALIAPLLAHDHIEVGQDIFNASQLGLDGPNEQLALYVPQGELFSRYLPNFPGGWHADELTFTTETNALDAAEGANPEIEILSVSGPAGGTFAFWEVGATSPTWTRPTGWEATETDHPSFAVVLNGENHAHGRAFTMDKPGIYTVVFRAVDATDTFAPSQNKIILFNAKQPPQLNIELSGDAVILSFTSLPVLSYDLQTAEDPTERWTNVEPFTGLSGNGSLIPMTVPRNGKLKAFFRLVEY